MRIIEQSLASDSLIAPSTNQTIVPSTSPSSSASFSPNSDPGMPTTTFHPAHNNNNHNHRPSSQPPPVIHQQPNQNLPSAGGGASDLKTANDENAGKFFIRGERSQPTFTHPPPPPISLLTNNQGYIPFASEFFPTDQGYFMPQELCAAAHAPICLHSEFGKIQTEEKKTFICTSDHKINLVFKPQWADSRFNWLIFLKSKGIKIQGKLK